MRQIWGLVWLQLRTLMLFAMLIAFLLLPSFNPEVKLLMFSISGVSWSTVLYNIVAFGVGGALSLYRYRAVRKWFRENRFATLKSLFRSDLAMMLLGAPLLMFDSGWLLLSMMLLYGLLLCMLDWCGCVKSKNLRFLYVSLVLFLFVNVVLTFVSWQNSRNKLIITATIVDDCRYDGEWLEDDDNWTIAQYRDGKMVHMAGPFEYPLFYDFGETKEGLNDVFIRQQYEHFVYRFGEDIYVLGTPSWKPQYRYLVNFTYMFALSLLVAFSIYCVRNWDSIRKPTFFTKLQSTFIYFFVVTLLVVFVAASVIIVGRHQRTACYNQQYRMQFLVKYFTPIIRSTEDCDSIVRSGVLQMANLFDANISLYDSEGKLFVSEGRKIAQPSSLGEFEENPFYNMPEMVYAQLVVVGGEHVVQSYAVFLDCAGEPIYMLMSSGDEIVKLKRNISLFLVIMFNLFFLVLGVSVLLSYFVSRKISAPLSLIESKMRDLELGEKNEKIEYPVVEGDALSKLVAEYNSMIDKLEVSAQALAKSEREASWRQMARQMAHEIKNPLTPMQLLTQRLLMLRGDDLQEYKMAVESSAKALLQGIESITKTTEALSNFAKTPIQPLEPIDIVESVRYTVDLFRNNEERVNIEFASTIDEAKVLVDKEMIGHVFNNLLKNAIQSIPEAREGQIEVKISEVEDNVVVSVKDNGMGIVEEDREKLFNVNFTTKTKGMGLGLLVVKNVVNQAKGTISFDSVEGEGTTFVVSFPALKK